MGTSSNPRIGSEGDLEVTFLYETHDLLASLVGPEYYRCSSDQVMFHSASRFNDFYVHVDELCARGREKVPLSTGPVQMSLLDAGTWFSQHHSAEAKGAGFETAEKALQDWLDASPLFRFWGAEIGQHVEFQLSRRGMIHYAANLHKHRMLRLGSIFVGLSKLVASSGSPLSEHQVVAIRDSFVAELQNRLEYLSTRLVQLLGDYFLALNKIVGQRRVQAGTNDASRMTMPAGITSSVFRDLYSSTLVFHSYSDERILQFTPTAPLTMKAHY